MEMVAHVPATCQIVAKERGSHFNAFNDVILLIFVVIIVVVAASFVLALCVIVCCVPCCIYSAPLCIALGCAVVRRVTPGALIKEVFWYTIYNHDVLGICMVSKTEKASIGRRLKVVMLCVSIISIVAAACVSQQISGAVSRQVFEKSKNTRQECLPYKTCLVFCKEEGANCTTLEGTLITSEPPLITDPTYTPVAVTTPHEYFLYTKPPKPSYKYYLCAADPICMPACKPINTSDTIDNRAVCASLPYERRDDLICGPKMMCSPILKIFMPTDEFVDISCSMVMAVLTMPVKLLFTKFLVLFQSKRESLGKTKVVIIQIALIAVIVTYMLGIAITGIVFTVLDPFPLTRLLAIAVSTLFGMATMVISPFPIGVVMFFLSGGVQRLINKSETSIDAAKEAELEVTGTQSEDAQKL